MSIRFRVKTLLILVFILAIPFGWLSFKARQARNEERAAKAIMNLGGSVFFNYQYADASSQLDKKANSTVSPLLQFMYGDKIFCNVTCVYMESNNVTNDDLLHLSKFPGLRRLHICGSKIDAEGLAYISDLTELQHLSLGLEMTDDGLRHLANLESLEHLYIMGPPQGMPFVLATDPNRRISDYYKYKSQVTRKGVEQLGEQLPSCQISY